MLVVCVVMLELYRCYVSMYVRFKLHSNCVGAKYVVVLCICMKRMFIPFLCLKCMLFCMLLVFDVYRP